MVSDIQKAITWIIEFLEENKIPYIICGGLACIGYGSNRALHDIDFYVPKKDFAKVVEFGKDYISMSACRVQNINWDIEFVQFTYKGIKIEIGSDNNIKTCNRKNGGWFHEKIKFDKYSLINLYGRDLKVMNIEDLIEYKSRLLREVDKLDLNFLKIKKGIQ